MKRTFKKIKNKIRGIVSDHIADLKIEDYDSKYEKNKVTEVHDGILFESTSKENLNDLISFYESAKNVISPDLQNQFFTKIRNSGVKITDYPRMEKSKKDDNTVFTFLKEHNHFSLGYNSVYLSRKSIKMKNYDAFFHEWGHILDYKFNNFEEGYGGVKWAMESFYPEIFTDNENKFSTFLVKLASRKFQNDFLEYMNKLDKNLELPDHQKNIDEIASYLYKKNCNSKIYDKELYEEYKKIAYNSYKESYVRKSGFASISDIWDSILKGDMVNSLLTMGNEMNYKKDENGYSILGTKSNYYGHGSNYYENIKSRSTEIMANVSALYNLGKIDLLNKYFPKEVVERLVATYETLVNDEYKDPHPRMDKGKEM